MNDKLMWQAGAILFGGFISVNSSQEIRLWILAIFLLVLIRLWFLWKPKDFMGRLIRPEILLLACGLSVGFIYGELAEKSIPKAMVLDGIEVKGVLKDWTAEEDAAKGIILLESLDFIQSNEIDKNVALSQTGRKYSLRIYPQADAAAAAWNTVKPGDRILFHGKLEHPPSPGTSGQLDLPLYYTVRGLSGSITAQGDVAVITEGSPPLAWQIRSAVRGVLDAHWPLEGGVLEGILFGDISRIAQETLDTYKAAGVMHVFAASGANVAFVIALALGVLFFLPLKSRIIVTIGIIIVYALLCKGNPPILRATILGIAVLLGMMGQGKVSGLRWLMFAALLMFIWQPLYLKDISFQLSFAAAWGMVVLSPRFEKSQFLLKAPLALRGAAAVAFSTQVAAFPILIDVFHRISLVGLITNIFALFLLGAVLQLGLIGTVLIVIPGLHLVFFQVSLWLLEVSQRILEKLASFPLAYFWVLDPGMAFWFAWYGVLAVYLTGSKKVWFIVRVQIRKGYLFLSKALNHQNFLERLPRPPSQPRLYLAISVLILGTLLWSPWSGEDRLEITFLDVGQGDCILICTPQETLLVDAGPGNEQFDAGERIVVPYLMEKRIGYLDMMFITHEDSDHLGGANYIISNVPTGKVAVPEVGLRLENEDWQRGIPRAYLDNPDCFVKLKAGDRLVYQSGLTIDVLAPTHALSNTSADANNNSLVLFLTYHDITILLTGDMEKEQMESLAARGAGWSSDFVKVPHHGGKSSFEAGWFDRIYPEAVFISVGRNSFGHPSPEVLAYWREREVPVYRTDLDGTIELLIDSKGYVIKTGRERKND